MWGATFNRQSAEGARMRAGTTTAPLPSSSQSSSSSPQQPLVSTTVRGRAMRTTHARTITGNGGAAGAVAALPATPAVRNAVAPKPHQQARARAAASTKSVVASARLHLPPTTTTANDVAKTVCAIPALTQTKTPLIDPLTLQPVCDADTIVQPTPDMMGIERCGVRMAPNGMLQTFCPSADDGAAVDTSGGGGACGCGDGDDEPISVAQLSAIVCVEPRPHAANSNGNGNGCSSCGGAQTECAECPSSTCREPKKAMRVNFCDVTRECVTRAPETQGSGSGTEYEQLLVCNSLVSHPVNQVTTCNPTEPGELRNLPHDEWMACVRQSVCESADATGDCDAIESVLVCETNVVGHAPFLRRLTRPAYDTCVRRIVCDTAAASGDCAAVESVLVCEAPDTVSGEPVLRRLERPAYDTCVRRIVCDSQPASGDCAHIDSFLVCADSGVPSEPPTLQRLDKAQYDACVREAVCDSEAASGDCALIDSFLVCADSGAPSAPPTLQRLDKAQYDECVREAVCTAPLALDFAPKSDFLPTCSPTQGLRNATSNVVLCNALPCVGPQVPSTCFFLDPATQRACRPYRDGDVVNCLQADESVAPCACLCDATQPLMPATIVATNGGRSLETDDDQPFTNVPRVTVETLANGSQVLRFAGLLTPNEQPIGSARTVRFTMLAVCPDTGLARSFDICARDDRRTWFVNADAPPTSDQSGTSWANAIADLQLVANTLARAGDQIWVAKGTYGGVGATAVREPIFLSTNDGYLFLDAGVSMYGGFDGTEQSLSERNWRTNKTVLEGEGVGKSENATSQVYGVIAIDRSTGEPLDSPAVLDGFYLQNWYSSGLEVLAGAAAFLDKNFTVTLSTGIAVLFSFRVDGMGGGGDIPIFIFSADTPSQIAAAMAAAFTAVLTATSIGRVVCIGTPVRSISGISNIDALRFAPCAPGTANSANGGALFVAAQRSNVAVRHVRFESNVRAIDVVNGGLTMRDSQVNASSGGGVLASSELGSEQAPLLFERVTFADNATAPNALEPGALHVRGPNLRLVCAECSFARNSGGGAGGGGAVLIELNSALSVVFNNCVFEENCTTRRGGAVLIVGSRSNVTQCVFTRNVAGVGGGAIAASVGSLLGVTQCTIARNAAGRSQQGSGGGGGAIFINGTNEEPSSLSLVNSILYNDVDETLRAEKYLAVTRTGTIVQFTENFASSSVFATETSERRLLGIGTNTTGTDVWVLAIPTGDVQPESFLLRYNEMGVKISDRRIVLAANPLESVLLADLAVQPFRDVLYAVGNDADNNATFYTIDTDTAQASVAGVLLNRFASGLAFEWCGGGRNMLVYDVNNVIVQEPRLLRKFRVNDATGLVSEIAGAVTQNIASSYDGAGAQIAAPLTVTFTRPDVDAVDTYVYNDGFIAGENVTPTTININLGQQVRLEDITNWPKVQEVVTVGQVVRVDVTSIVEGVPPPPPPPRDPLFVDPFNGNLRLLIRDSEGVNNPAVDTGTNGFTPDDTDIDGGARVVNGTDGAGDAVVDIGAYEFCPSPCRPFAIVSSNITCVTSSANDPPTNPTYELALVITGSAPVYLVGVTNDSDSTLLTGNRRVRPGTNFIAFTLNEPFDAQVVRVTVVPQDNVTCALQEQFFVLPECPPMP